MSRQLPDVSVERYALTGANILAGVLLQENRLEEATPLLLRSFERRKALLGPGHLDTLHSLSNLATLYYKA